MNNDQRVTGVDVRLAMETFDQDMIDQIHAVAPELLQAIVEVEQILSARAEHENECQDCESKGKYAMRSRYGEDIYWSIKRLKKAMRLTIPKT